MKRSLATVVTSQFVLGLLAGGAIVWLLKAQPGTPTPQSAQAAAVEQAQGKEPKARRPRQSQTKQISIPSNLRNQK